MGSSSEIDVGEEEKIVIVQHGDEGECVGDECNFSYWSNKACDGRNEIGKWSDYNKDDCLRMCLDDPTCLSAEFGIKGSNKDKCQLSRTCNQYNFKTNDEFDLYLRL